MMKKYKKALEEVTNRAKFYEDRWLESADKDARCRPGRCESFATENYRKTYFDLAKRREELNNMTFIQKLMYNEKKEA